MPVVVGGTHYYIQSLLWRDTLLDTKKGAGTVSNIKPQDESDANEKFLKESDTPTLYQKLKEIDPIMAKKWHENDRRKITRSLQVGSETFFFGRSCLDENNNGRRWTWKASWLRATLICFHFLGIRSTLKLASVRAI